MCQTYYWPKETNYIWLDSQNVYPCTQHLSMKKRKGVEDNSQVMVE